MRLRRTKVAMALGAGGVVLVAAQATSAQDLRVTVTGTNIKRTETETAAPIETITREDIQASGLQTISDVVRQITANNNGTITPSFINGFSPSTSAVSLRGLGPNNTLVLLNGRRLANFGLADDSHVSYVDLQQIPFDAVERIEILKDGASAIYGADAVAGVVNVILRQQYTGFTITGTAGTNENGQGSQYKGAVTWGMGDLTRDRYNVFLTIDGQKQKAIPANKARAYMGTNDLRFMGLPDARPGNPFLADFGTASPLGNVRPFPANAHALAYGSTWASLPGPCAPGDRDGPFCRWDPLGYWTLQPEIERLNVYARGTYNFPNAVQGYTELSLFKVRTETATRPPPTQGIWYDPSSERLNIATNLFLPLGHPDNPYSTHWQVARLRYVDASLGSLASSYDTTTQRYLAGVKGTAAQWDWDVGALYIRSETDWELSHAYSYSRLKEGLLGTGPYGYYRIGANAGLNDPSIYGWIAPTRSSTTVSENAIVDAKASRDIYRLAGGPLALAVGYEFRHEQLSNPGLPGTETGDVMNFSRVAASGSRNVNAIFAELYAPVLRNLELTAAARLDDYSDFGTTVNPKLGVKWTVTPQLVLRGTFETAFRAPGPYEIQPSVLGGRGVARDPVRCPVTSADADCDALFGILIFGNPNVQPEKSTTYTAGVIWEPVPGLSGTLDYWYIRTRNQITGDNLQAILDDPAGHPQSTIVRDPDNALPGIPDSGSLLSVTIPWQNSNSITTDGIDIDIVWKQAFGAWGTLRAELQWTHIFQYTQVFADGTTRNYVGTQGNYDVSSAGGMPQDRANLILGWQRGPWNVTGTVRYVSDYQSIGWRGDVTDEGAPNCISPLDGPDCHVASFATLDLSASYSGFKNWQIFGSVINVFNRLAPFNPAAAYGGINYNYNYAFSGAAGTQFNLGARYTFQ